MVEAVSTAPEIEAPESDPADLSSALLSANLPSLIGVLAHMTGDNKWLTDPYRPRRARGLDDNDDGGFPPDIQEEIRRATASVVAAVRAGVYVSPNPSPSRIAEILGVVLAEEVPEEYGPILCEELAIRTRTVKVTSPPVQVDFSVGVIGAGMSGIAAAVALHKSGIAFEVIEKNPSVGGVWHENTYPGCGVDTPSSLYSYSFAPNHEWSRYFAKRDEVAEYFTGVAAQHGVAEHIHYGREVVSATYDCETSKWKVVVRDAHGWTFERTYSALISAVGQVNRPATPALAGADDFQGDKLHTAAWDNSVNLTGKSVAVIGTGASAMQLVPAIAENVGQVTVFQRTKQWALPHPNYQRHLADGVKVLNKLVPFYERWYRLRTFWNFGDRLFESLRIDPHWSHPERSVNEANDHHRAFLTKYITQQLGDHSDLLDRTVPSYPPYLKRPLIDNGWYHALTRSNVELVDTGVARITPHGVVDQHGVEHSADVLIYATGFNILQFLAPMHVCGRSGVSIRDAWGTDDARAYLGITVPDFPNLFILNGPNTFAGHGGSAILTAEFQVRYAMQAIERLASGAATSVEVRQDVFDAYNVEVDAALNEMIWSHRGATSYFRNDAGRVVVNCPWNYVDYWRRTLRYEPADYVERKD